VERSLANLAKRNSASQHTGQDRLKRMQYRPGFLGGFLASTGLGLTPFRHTTIKELLGGQGTI
jgi:hypothetical protein